MIADGPLPFTSFGPQGVPSKMIRPAEYRVYPLNFPLKLILRSLPQERLLSRGLTGAPPLSPLLFLTKISALSETAQ
jgi:hypothetical protein